MYFILIFAASQTFSAHLDFIVKDCDPETGDCDEEGYEDTYTLEDVQLQLADIMQAVEKPNFAAAWEELAVR
jgi:coatomer protein complex subunit gamma